MRVHLSAKLPQRPPYHLSADVVLFHIIASVRIISPTSFTTPKCQDVHGVNSANIYREAFTSDFLQLKYLYGIKSFDTNVSQSFGR